MRRGIVVLAFWGVLAARKTPRSQLAGDLLQESAVLQAMASSLLATNTSGALRSERSTAPSPSGTGLLQGSAGMRAAHGAENSTQNSTQASPNAASTANRAAREEMGESTMMDRMERQLMRVDYDAMEKVMGIFGYNMSAQANYMRELQAQQLKIEAHDLNMSNHYRSLNRQRVVQSGNLSGLNINLTAEECHDNRLWRTFIDRNYTLSTGYVTTAGEAFDCASYANEGLCVDPGWFGRTEGPCVPNRNKYFLGENFSFPEKNCCACGKMMAASKVCTGLPYGGALGSTVLAVLLALSF